MMRQAATPVMADQATKRGCGECREEWKPAMYPIRIHREENGQKIPGILLRAYIHNGPYHLTEIAVFQDGMIDCWGLVTFARFKQKVEEGWIVTALPGDAKVSMFPLGSFTATHINNGVSEGEFVKEVSRS
jgi:hypothetical protein